MPAPTAYQPQTTYISSYTNGIYFNQLAGANAPWLSTNAVPVDPANVFGTNASLFVGQTNQWHFYMLSNSSSFTNAAFVTIQPVTLSMPRMGVTNTATFTVTVHLPPDVFRRRDPEALKRQFDEEHLRRYGTNAPDERAEIVSLRASLRDSRISR